MPSKPLSLAGATAVGFGLAYLFDPDSGKRRRKLLGDQLAAKARRGADSAVGAARGVGAKAGGAVASVTSDETPPPNDQALAEKVKSEVLGDPDVPKGQINVDVSDGIVALRGEVENRELMQSLDARVREVTGVRDVQNLLHLPGESPPNLSPVPGGSG